ncbi:MAG TPA: amidohydrolase family protein [Actinomycetota bacterium]|nr:amidohydrolase family protein [Actinomycetota bacterium]
MPKTLAISGGTVLVGRDLRAERDATVVVSDGRIAAAGTGVAIPADATTIDATGATVVPGFIDAHVHIGFVDPIDVLRGGVTTVRDLAWPPEKIFPLAAASLEEGFAGPLVLCAGPMITAPGGYPTRAAWAPRGTGVEIGTVDDARRVVTDVVARGATVVKIALNAAVGPTLPAELVAAIVEAAHARKRKVTAHIDGLDELVKALDAGIDEMAHVLMSADHIPEEVVDRIVEQGVAVVPTLSIFSGRSRHIAIENVARLAAAGARIVYGTDLGNAGPRPGIDRREIDGLRDAGFTPMDIIRSATVTSAEWLDLETKGAIESGADGDLVIVEGDPATDAGDLTKIRRALRGGIAA